MDITKIDEIWIEYGHERCHSDWIVAVSNTGKYRRANSEEGILGYKSLLRINGRHVRAYKFIAECFLVTVHRPDQTHIDHITHSPSEYNINDVRNLRWCTNAENMAFPEAVEHQKKSSYWRGVTGKNHPRWLGGKITSA